MQAHQPLMPAAAGVQSSGIIHLQPGYVAVQAALNPSDFAVNTFKKQCLGLVVIGVLAFIANFIAIISGDPVSLFGYGFWCGTPFIISGVFGIGAMSKNRCLNMRIVVVILRVCATLANILFFISLAGILVNAIAFNSGVTIAMEVILAVLGVAAFLLSTWGISPSPSPVINHAVPVLDQQPAMNQNENIQRMAVPTLPSAPPVLDQPVPSGFLPAQQHYINTGPCAPSSPISSRDCQPEPAGTPPPSYAELYGQKH